jgi:hypothetical protein
MKAEGYKDQYQPNYRINSYRTYLRSAGFVSNTSRGIWRVIYHIPTWCTLNALEIARGYKGTNHDKTKMKEKIVKYQTECSIITGNRAGKLVEKETEPPFKVGDRVIYVPNSNSDYKESDYAAEKDGLIPGNIYTISKSFLDVISDSLSSRLKIQWVQIKEGKCKFNLAADCFKLVQKETELEPTAEWPYVVKCKNNHTEGYTDRLTVGKLYRAMDYEVRGNNTKFFRLETFDNGIVSDSGTYAHRFEVVKEYKKEETMVVNNPSFKVGDKVKLVTFKSNIYDRDCFFKLDGLTVGEEYEITSIGHNGQLDKFGPNSFLDLKGKIYCHPRDCFELVESPIKVGHKLLADFLNNNEHKWFYGYSIDNGWTYRKENFFIGDRHIEKIKEINGRLAGLISDTSDLWIAIESVKCKNNSHSLMPIINESNLKNRELFIQELNDLLKKHSK